jgi:SAM-dependent methyltransferase
VSGYAVPDRVRWAVEQLEFRPTARVLEFGAGSGAAAWLVCPQLTSGTMLAVDRSASAVARTRQRCAEHLASGRLAVRQAALAELDVAGDSIDIAFGVNVNLFWTTSAEPELGLLHHALAGGGQLLIAYGPGPPGSDQQAVLGRVRDNVEAAGFGPARIVVDPRASAVIARRR